MPDAKRVKVFHESDEEDAPVGAQPLTEFSAETLSKAEAAPLIVPKLQNTFRSGRKGYAPGLLAQPGGRADGKSIEELELAEKSRNRAYGLTGSKTASSEVKGRDKGQTDLLADVSDERASTSILSHKQAGPESHPDMASLDDYEAVPVESFGMAMLRGMGYDPATQPKAKDETRERRLDFLGLGATQRPEETKTTADLAKKRHEVRKEERIYVPVVKINKRTGERIVEGAAEPAVQASAQAALETTSAQDHESSRPATSRSVSSKSHAERRHRSRSRSREPRRHRSRSPSSRTHRRRDRSRDYHRDADRLSHRSNRDRDKHRSDSRSRRR